MQMITRFSGKGCGSFVVLIFHISSSFAVSCALINEFYFIDQSVPFDSHLFSIVKQSANEHDSGLDSFLLILSLFNTALQGDAHSLGN